MAALSNGNLALLVDLVRHGDMRFDCLLSAELAQVYKPEAEVYLTGVRLLGLEPGAVMMVAAHPFDLNGARGAELRTADAVGWHPARKASGVRPYPRDKTTQLMQDRAG